MKHVRAEGAFRASVWGKLPAYRVADAATDALTWVLAEVAIAPAPDDPPASYWQQRALLYLGVLTLRETRAVLVLLASGYEAEVLPHMRTIMEAGSRAQSVENDPSGSYAKSWLGGKAGKPSAAFAKIDAGDLWGLMSHHAHADHRAVENMYAVTRDDGHHDLLLMPERRPDVSSSTAAMAAGSCRDMARVVATAFELEIPDLDMLDAAINALPLWRGSDDSGSA